MQTIHKLFIRACKTKNPDLRVRSVYRRFYLTMVDDQLYVNQCILSVLTAIVDKYCPMTTCKSINALNPFDVLDMNNVPTSVDHAGYIQHAVAAMISQIRFSEKDKFPGLVHPYRLHTPKEV